MATTNIHSEKQNIVKGPIRQVTMEVINNFLRTVTRHKHYIFISANTYLVIDLDFVQIQCDDHCFLRIEDKVLIGALSPNDL